MAVNEYVLGTPVELTVTFTNLAGDPTDPSTVVCKVKKPDDTESDFTGTDLANDDTGVYSTIFVADQVGDWRYRWEGSGALVAATEAIFTVWSAFS